MLTVGGADGFNHYSRNLWISGVGDPANIDIRKKVPRWSVVSTLKN
jgi:hypothetical protein